VKVRDNGCSFYSGDGVEYWQRESCVNRFLFTAGASRPE
jgi:hypothetical protein